MHASGSILQTCCERVRAFLDSPDLAAKYSDQWLVQHVIGPAFADVVGRSALTTDNEVLLRFEFTPTEGQEWYQLPPLRSVERVALYDDNLLCTQEILPMGEFHACGPVYELEGNLLAIRPLPTIDATDAWTVLYVPSGDVEMHRGTGALDAGKTVLTLAVTPTLGLLDRRHNAYCGQVLRVIPATGPVEERIISAHDVVAGTVTVRVAFTSAAVGSNLYEIVPLVDEGVTDAVSAYASCRMAIIRSETGPKYRLLMDQARNSMKTFLDATARRQARTGKSRQQDTVDRRW